MSNVYASEPSTSGRVLIETTHGPLDIQLWSRECPLATKLFLQLCMDGFYDGMIFHRIVADFLIQTGAIRMEGNSKPGSTNSSGFDQGDYRQKIQATEALERRKYETHSRLRFNHRGQVAMALGVTDEDDVLLQPQFFITLDEAPYLDGKHVVFGTCAGGPTVFNALRIGKLVVDDKNFEHAPRIKSVKVTENPIHTSIAPLANVPWRVVEANKPDKKKKKRKGKKDLKLLSFGDEMDDGAATESSGIKSMHDVVTSKSLSKSVDQQVKDVLQADSKLVGKSRPESHKSATKNSETARNDAVDPPTFAGNTKSKKEKMHQEISIDQQPASKPKKKPKKSLVEERLAKFKLQPKSKQQREEETMSKLLSFQGKVKKQTADRKRQAVSVPEDNSLAAKMARKVQKQNGEATQFEHSSATPTYRGQILEDDDDDKHKADWMGTSFKCKKHMDHASRLGDMDFAGDVQEGKGSDGRNINDYEVIDSANHSHHQKGRRRNERQKR